MQRAHYTKNMRYRYFITKPTHNYSCSLVQVLIKEYGRLFCIKTRRYISTHHIRAAAATKFAISTYAKIRAQTSGQSKWQVTFIKTKR